MTVARVKKAAALRGIRFAGEKKWLNNMVGYGYEFFTPNGTGFRQAGTLIGAYRQVMVFKKLGKETV